MNPMETTIKDIEKNLQDLSPELLIQVNDYIEFLKERYSVSHSEIPQWQKDEVLRRKKEAEQNPDIMKPIEELYKILDEDEL